MRLGLWERKGGLTSAGSRMWQTGHTPPRGNSVAFRNSCHLHQGTNRQDMMARGNLLADQAAGAAAWQTVTVMSLGQQEVIPELPEIEKIYEDLPEEEEQWAHLGVHRRGGH